MSCTQQGASVRAARMPNRSDRASWLAAGLIFAVCAAAPPPARAIPPLAATFSIVARDTTSGEIGVGVSSHWFSVGTSVPWAEADVGAVATQSFVEMAYGPNILARIKKGERATDALLAELAADTLSDLRQVLVIDAKGNCGAHTGEECMPFAGHHVARDHVCAGNLLLSADTWDKMSLAFEHAEGRLADRILAALEAGQAAGGDARGKQSAAMIVYKMVDPENPWKNKIVDLRVEDNPNPVYELGRIYTLHVAYDLADQGDTYFAKKDYATALRFYDAAVDLAPGNDEILFWRGSMKSATGRLEDAVDDVGQAIYLNERWKPLIARLPDKIFPGVEKVCKRLSIERTK
jgi:uncharacterized Ntn-hydrolase superfamily protein